MTIQLTEADESAIAAKHDAAAKRITDLAAGVPRSVDAGYGTADVLAIVAAVVATSDDLALIDEVAADQVIAVGQGFGTTDDQVADNFDRLEVVVGR